MHRRPWPIVILALIQFLTPLASIWVSAIANRISFVTMSKEIWIFSSDVEKLKFFALPIALGFLIYFTKKLGFYFVLLASAYTIYGNIQEWVMSGKTTSIWMIVGVNAVVMMLVAYLLLPNVRAVFFNPRMRWWETAPRFILEIACTYVRTGSEEKSAKLTDLAVGGAGIEVSTTGILNEELVTLKFKFNDEEFVLPSKVVYHRNISDSKARLGLQWTPELTNQEHSKLRRLTRQLKAARYPETRKTPEWKSDFVSWLGRAKKSPKAWMPEGGAGEKPRPPTV